MADTLTITDNRTGKKYELPIPPGRHRLMLDNVGGDWACIGWYAVTGETLDP